MAAKSMTGMGRASVVEDGVRVDVELRCVNRKQFDFDLSAPPEVAAFDRRWREIVQQGVSRGRVQCQIRVTSMDRGEVAYDVEAIRSKVDELKALAAEVGVPFDVGLASLVAMPGMTRTAAAGLDAEALERLVASALEQAVVSLNSMRAAEGAALAADLVVRIAALEEHRSEVALLAPQVPQRHQEALKRRVAELGATLVDDDAALAREVALFADRCDITEELTRIDAHLFHFLSLLQSPEPSGRPLDFLCQELHREVNTAGSKANDVAIAQHVIEMKAGVEAIREQVQNLE
ncbi:MAG: YicC/YloC family endoribonuclease [Kiritimatiellia bacterium]